MSDRLDARVTPAEIEEAKKTADKYHPIYGIQRNLIIDGVRYDYNRYLDCWVGWNGHEMTGETILNGMSTTLRVEVAS
jgi:hypothetical protein